MICKGEYPNSITVNILNTDNAVIKNTSIPTQVNDQLMIITGNTSITNFNTFTVNVSLSNNGGKFNGLSSLGFSFLGPVTDIASVIDNCSTIDIIWTAPTVDDRVSIQYYILRIYDAINGSLVDTVSVHDTSYQFVDNDLFIHRYIYVITGVNELGEGISNSDTLSYQRVPRAAENTSLEILCYTQEVVIVQFYVPITLKCTGEAPEHATITVICNGTDAIIIYQIKHIDHITGLTSLPIYEQCSFSIVFTNGAGSSEPFILAFDTYPPSPNITTTATTTTQSSSTTTPVATSLNITYIGTVIAISISLGVVIILLLLLIISLIVLVIICKRKAYRFASSQQQQQEVPTAYNEAYQFNNLMITDNPAYEEIRQGGRAGAINM